MMEKLPYKLYFDCLVQSRMQFPEIGAKLQELSLSPFPVELESAVSNSMREFKNTYPDKDMLPKDIRNMLSHLSGLPVKFFNELFDLVNDITMRRWIQSLLLANFDIATIYILVSSKSERLYNEESFHLFERYFFNVKSYNIKDKYVISETERDVVLNGFYKLSLSHEKEELLWTLGFTPDLSIEYIVKNIAAESLMRFKKTQDDDKASKLGTLALRAAEKLKDLDMEKKKDLETALGFDFKVLQEKPVFKTKKEIDNEIL